VLTVVPGAADADDTRRDGGASLIDEIVREGARRMLAEALQAEVDAYIARFVADRDENGRRLVVRNGSHQPREVLTSAGAVEVTAPRVNDRRVDADTGERARFASAILPAWCRKTPKITEADRGLEGRAAAPSPPGICRRGLRLPVGRRHPRHIRLEEHKLCLLVISVSAPTAGKNSSLSPTGTGKFGRSWADLCADCARRGPKSRSKRAGKAAGGLRYLRGLRTTQAGSPRRTGLVRRCQRRRAVVDPRRGHLDRPGEVKPREAGASRCAPPAGARSVAIGRRTGDVASTSACKASASIRRAPYGRSHHQRRSAVPAGVMRVSSSRNYSEHGRTSRPAYGARSA